MPAGRAGQPESGQDSVTHMGLSAPSSLLLDASLNSTRQELVGPVSRIWPILGKKEDLWLSPTNEGLQDWGAREGSQRSHSSQQRVMGTRGETVLGSRMGQGHSIANMQVCCEYICITHCIQTCTHTP